MGMFLRRKFPDADGRAPPPGEAHAAGDLPARVRDVVANLDVLLGTRRGVGHVLPDFGFTQSGNWNAEGLITQYTTELRENVARYEPRLTILDVDGEPGEDGRPELVVEARITGAAGEWVIAIDLAASCVVRVERG
jgi:predicted component of type VI protein secretion system